MSKHGVNWEYIFKRHGDFWKRESRDVLLAVTTLKDGAVPESFPFPEGRENRIKWWTDAEQIIKRFRSRLEKTYYAGDAFPILSHNLGPAGHAGFFKNAKPRYESSIWYEPSLDDYNDLVFDENSFLYQKTLEMAKAYVEDAKGEYMVSMPDVVSDSDVLSHLRGPENFICDLVDRPEEVKAALKIVQTVWEKTMRGCYDIVAANNRGGSCVGWLNTWAPGFHAQLQCDASVMFSPEMFEEFICYELEAQAGFLDYSLYHLDGPQQVRHLPYILAVEKLDAIQWTNVVGQAPVTAFIPELQQIQQAGKLLVLDCSPDEVSVLLDNLKPEGVYIRTWADNPGEADDLVGMVRSGN